MFSLWLIKSVFLWLRLNKSSRKCLKYAELNIFRTCSEERLCFVVHVWVLQRRRSRDKHIYAWNRRFKCLELFKRHERGWFLRCLRGNVGIQELCPRSTSWLYEACLISRSKPTGRRPKSTEHRIYFSVINLEQPFFCVQYKKITDVAQRNLHEQLFALWAQS